MGLKGMVNNGQKIRFWEDVWVGEIPLKLEFPTLYQLCRDKNCLISNYWGGDGWKLVFTRPLGREIC